MGCSNGTCDLGTQQNVATSSYKLKCSDCEHSPPQSYDGTTCPKCGSLLYWSYEPNDGLTDYQRRMIKLFYGNLTDTKVVLNHDR